MAKPTPEDKAQLIMAQLDEKIREARGIFNDLYALKRDVEKDLPAKVHELIGTAAEEALQELAEQVSKLREHIVDSMDTSVRREIDGLMKTIAQSPYGQQLFTVAASLQQLSQQHAATGMKHELAMDLELSVPGRSKPAVTRLTTQKGRRRR